MPAVSEIKEYKSKKTVDILRNWEQGAKENKAGGMETIN
jgi:hypothetical protein